MKLNNEFYKLPFTFDVARLQHEVSQFTEQDWVGHHENFNGNSAIPLISVKGEQNNLFKGLMQPTAQLQRCPYISQVIASFDETIGRSRLMRLAPGAEVPLHSDINYHWYHRVRIHIPVFTAAQVMFHCGDKAVNMRSGDCWIFDSWRPHKVVNNSDQFRVHLVVDTAGSAKFWHMVNHLALAYNTQDTSVAGNRHLACQGEQQASFRTERFNFPLVMSPGELDGLIAEFKHDLVAYSGNVPAQMSAFIAAVDEFRWDWRALYSQYAELEAGWPLYHQLRNRVVQRCSALQELRLNSGQSALSVLVHLIVASCLNPDIVRA